VTSGLSFADAARTVLTQGYAAAYLVGKKDAKKALPKPVPIVDPDAAEALPGDIQQTGGDEGIDSSEVNSDDETLGPSNPAFDENTDEGDDSDITDEWDDSGDDTLDDDGQEAVDGASDNIEDSLFGFGALLVGTQASIEQLDAWLGTYANTLNPLYEEGFQDGVQAGGEIEQATWVSETDGAVCEDCKNLNGMTWVGDEIDAAMPHPGDSEFGGRTECGPNCRCSIDYTVVPADQAVYSWGGFDDSVEEVSTADLLKTWAILRKYSDDEARDDHGQWTSGGGTGDQICDRITAG
jgi:hypothetical protein